MILLLKALSRLPLGFLYLLSNALAWTAEVLLKYRRSVVIQNLRRSFPERSESEINQIAHDFYRHLADLIVESLKAITISPATLKKRVSFSNSELFDTYSQRFPAVVALTLHLGNWEWMHLASCVRYSFAIHPLYLPLTNKSVDKLMFQTRNRFGGEPLPSFRALVKAMKTSSTFRAFVLLADQIPPPGANNYWTQFLNQETAFLPGIEQLPKLIDCPVIFVWPRRTKRGYYEVCIEQIAVPPFEQKGEAIMEAYVHMAERVINENPDQWLWSHQRWKHPKPSAS